MLSTKYKFIFIHVPKTGGNSIQSVLSRFSEDEIVATETYHDSKERFEVKGVHPKLKKHSKLEDYRTYLDREFYEDLYKFSIVRNPWERLISLYFTPSSGRNEWSREAFLRLVERTASVEHYIALSETWWSRFSGKRASDLDRDLDYLIRYENLESDFHEVCRRLSLPEAPIPAFNKSTRAHYSTYYDDELVHIIDKKFRKEIEWGGYLFKKAHE